VLAGLALAIFGAIAFGPYVSRGGFMYDEWEAQAIGRLQGFGTLFNHVISVTPRRPLGALYWAVLHTLFGAHEHVYLVQSATLRVSLSLVLFVLLRELRLDRVSAGAAAVLALLFPFSDTTWLWGSVGQLSLSLICWLGGVLAALRGLRPDTRGWKWHALAVLLYVASILTYEDTLIVVVIGGVLYLGLAPRGEALRRWAADIGGVSLAVLFFTSRWIDLAGGHGTHVSQGIGGTLNHIKVIADQGLTVGARSVVPFGAPERWAVVAGVLLVVVVAAWVAWRTPEAALRNELRNWLCAGAAGTIVTISGWGMLAAADVYYSPAQVGIGNRINAMAAIGLALVAVTVVRLAGTLAFSGLPRDRRVASAVLTVVMTAGIAGAYLDLVKVDRRDWWRARAKQGAVIERVRSSIASPPAGSTIIARGFPLYEAPGVPVFAASWDLDGAVKLLWHNSSLHAVPAPPGALRCGPSGVTVAGGTTHQPAEYRHTYLIDAAKGPAVRIDSLRQCNDLARVA